MRNASIFYFSGTGNTWWTSVQLQKHLSAEGIQAETVSIEAPEKIIKEKIETAEIIFLLYPIYGSDRPEIVKDFINDLPQARGKEFGIICTQLMFSGDGAWFEHELIESRGYSIRWTAHIRMPNNISVPAFPLPYTNDKTRLEKLLMKADRKLAQTASYTAQGISKRQGASRLSNLLGLMQRKPFRKMFHSIQDLVSINSERCTKCGKCIRLCPIGNIIFADEEHGGFPEFQGHCNLCLRCYNFCPAQAVMYDCKNFKPKARGRKTPYRGPVDDFNPEILKG